jgi:hypothetical protein
MKNTRKPYEEELNSRLRNYSEEPGPEMWEGISARLAKPGNDSIWTEWPNLVSGIVLVSLSFLSYQTQVSVNREPALSLVEHSTPMSSSGAAALINESESKPLKPINRDNIRSASIAYVATEEARQERSSTEILSPAPISYSESMESTQFPQGDQQVPSSAGFTATLPASDSSRVEPVMASRRDTVVVILGKTPEDRQVRRHYTYTAYFTVTPMLGFQRVEFNTTDNILVSNLDERPVLSADRFGVHLALGMEIPLSKKFTLSGGFTYLQRNLSFTYTERALDSTSLSTGPEGEIILTPNFSYPKREFNYDFRSGGLQFGVLYKLSSDKPRPLTVADALSSGTMMPRKRFVHFVGAGLEWQWTISKTTAENNPYGFESPAGYSFVNVYYRLQYPHEGRLKAILQPTFNYSFFSNQTTSGLVRIKPYGFGVSLGCTYTF